MLETLVVLRTVLWLIGLWTVVQWLRAGWRRLFGVSQPKATEIGEDWLTGQDRQASRTATAARKPSPPPAPPPYVAPIGRTVKIKPTTISFGYRDSKGDVTDRVVVVRVVQPETFTGRCLMRGQDRTFKWSRVLGRMIVDETGQVLHAHDAYDELAS